VDQCKPLGGGVICVTGDSANAQLAAARGAVGAAADVVIGGAGNKILAVVGLGPHKGR